MGVLRVEAEKAGFELTFFKFSEKFFLRSERFSDVRIRGGGYHSGNFCKAENVIAL